MFYSITQSAAVAECEKRNDLERQVASDQALIQATACAVVDKLNSGEVTPLDLLDVLESRIADSEHAAAVAKSERDEARAILRRIEEGTASRRIFAGLKPVCCPRCSTAFPESRTVAEEETGRCSICDRRHQDA